MYSSFEKALLWKVIRYSYHFFYFLFCLRRYHFYNFLEFHSTLSEKDFLPNFFLFNGFTPPTFSQPTPVMSKICKNWQMFCQFFLKCLLIFFFKDLLTNSCKVFFNGSNYRFYGLLFRTYFKNSYFETSISNYL